MPLKSDFKKYYKKPPSTFGNARKIRVSLGHEQRTSRRKHRTQDFEENRKVNSPGFAVSQNDKPRTELLHWKAERERKKKTQESQKKPPFVVGRVHHHIYSPISMKTALVASTGKKKTVEQANKISSVKNGITKATEKRLLAKAANIEVKLKTDATSARKKSATKNKVESDNKRKSFAPPNHKFNPPAGLTRVSLFSEVCIEDGLLNENNIFARDKSTETADQKSVKEETCSSGLSDGFTTKCVIVENLDLSISPIGEKEYTVEYFERALNKEKDRLQKLCEKWTEIQLQDDVAVDIPDRINQTVGQTTMLIKEKFKQFHGLLLDCKRNDGDALVTCTDLHGFWDMMYIEVKDCDSRFAKLEELRARHWQEAQSFVVESKEKAVAKMKVAPTKQSSLQALILFDKKKKEIAKCVTPCMTNKRAVLRKSSNVTRDKRFLEVPDGNCMYTSTPFSISGATSNNSNQLSTPLITMKVSQLYNKSTVCTLNNSTLLDDTMLWGQTPGQTPRKSSIKRSGKNSLRIKPACKTNLEDHLAMTRESDEKFKIDQNSGASSTEMTKPDNLDSVERTHTEGKSNSASDGSIENTMIENVVTEKSNTLVSSLHSTDLSKTPERKKSINESSNKKLKTRLFKKSSKHPVVKSSYGIPSTVNNLPTPRDASLIHVGFNNEITPNRVMHSRRKKCNSNIKVSWDRAIISDGKISRSMETIACSIDIPK